jgi:hypothetical protein
MLPAALQMQQELMWEEDAVAMLATLAQLLQ